MRRGGYRLRLLAGTTLFLGLAFAPQAGADTASHESHGAPANHETSADHRPEAASLPAAGAASGHGATMEHDAHGTHDMAGHDLHGKSEAEVYVRGGFTREEEKAYSLFMHRSCGAILAVLGVLVLSDRLTQRRYGLLRKGMGLMWLLMGVHILFNADPTDWPLAASFMESYHRPGSSEWLQHKVLSLIPMAIGLYTMLVARREKPSLIGGVTMSVVLAVGGAALLYHEHEHSPGMDMALIVRQHNLMAYTALFIAAGWLADTLERLSWKPKFAMVPLGLIALGLELAIYTE